MVTPTYPKYREKSFNCPHCAAFAYQSWQHFHTSYYCAECKHCNDISIWYDGEMVYPMTMTAPPPNPDMPPDVVGIFEEARKILSISPRASAGLLRLCVEKLIEHLGEKEADLNARIASLVENGLSPDVQKALDVVRVTGNRALHSGQIGISDSHETAQSLFDIVNIIVQRMISDKKQIENMYRQLPKEKLSSISDRDRNDQELKTDLTNNG